MRATDPQISFADLEFLSQGIQLDPVLEQILQFVTRSAVLVETVRRWRCRSRASSLRKWKKRGFSLRPKLSRQSHREEPLQA
jgi:hypothetical protein